MNIRPTILATFLCLPVFGSAHAEIISGYGAVADTGTYGSCAVICLRPGGLNDQIVNGGEFATSASASINNSTATSFGSASFTGDVFSPVLNSWSGSPEGSNSASDAIVTAVQAWTYTGPTTQDFSIDLSLSGSITEPPGGSAEGSIEGRAAVYLFPNATFGTDFSSFILEEVANLGTLLDSEQLFLLPALDLSSGTLDFVADPGDELYVWMQLETKSERGAIVDAQNTFEMAFAAGDTSLLEETITPDSPTPVPAPPTLWLIGIGVAGICAARRHLG
jgi:hypothetical protein